VFGFVPLPPGFVLLLLGITAGYLVASELVKDGSCGGSVDLGHGAV
jgi:hypothetical protein